MIFSSLTLLAIQTALGSGTILKKGFETGFEIREKEGVHNLVTEMDLKSEEWILSSLKKAFPLPRLLLRRKRRRLSHPKRDCLDH